MTNSKPRCYYCEYRYVVILNGLMKYCYYSPEEANQKARHIKDTYKFSKIRTLQGHVYKLSESDPDVWTLLDIFDYISNKVLTKDGIDTIL